MTTTHPVQKAALAGIMIFNGLSVLWVQHMKKQGKVPEVAWETKKKVYATCMIAICALNLFLDANFAIGTRVMLIARIFTSVTPVGILDLYYSSVEGIDVGSVMGTGKFTHFVIRIFFPWLCDKFHGRHMPFVILQAPASIADVCVEIVRILGMFIFSAIFADLIFSPVHRFLHNNPKLYRRFHKKHHEYTKDVTSFIGFHSDAADDLVMAAAIEFGGLCYRIAVQSLFPGWEAYSNLTYIFHNIGGYLAHAHDTRIVQLLVPGLPDSLNVMTYHHVHHLHPNRNFGLSLGTDMF